MALTSTKLATELQAMVPVETEAEGIENFADAFNNYFFGATAQGISISEISLLSSAKEAMKLAMVGVNNYATGGSIKIQQGIVAYWGVVCLSASTLWITVPPIVSMTPPPSLASISLVLDVIFATNIVNKLNLVASALAVADGLHVLQLGAIATLVVSPPTTVPIL